MDVVLVISGAINLLLCFYDNLSNSKRGYFLYVDLKTTCSAAAVMSLTLVASYVTGLFLLFVASGR